jgi:hypothetical protein
MTGERPAGVAERPLWKQAALPAEHGGWGLTLEPILLGLLIVPSWAGLALGLAAFGAFLARTPLKLALVDQRREQWRERSRLAARVALAELAVIAGCAVWAFVAAGATWLVPVAVAVPFVAVGLWFDVRSRGRRLLPELCGAVGIAGVTAAIVLAGGRSGVLAAAAWLVLAGRSVGAIPFVRAQIMRLRRGAGQVRDSDTAQLCAVAIGAVAVAIDRRAAVGLGGLVVLAALQVAWVRRPPTAPKVLGLRQMALGFALVLATAVGAWVL